MARIAAFGTPRASNIQEGAGQCSGAQILAGWGTIYMRQFFYNAILLFAAPSLLLGQVSSYMSTAAPSTNGADNDPVLTITRRVSEVNALFDAIYRACKEKLAKEKYDRPTRRALIVISDGEDNQSEATRAQAIEMAQRAEVLIYAISTDDSGLILRGDKSLQQLADFTGGRAFFPYKMKDIKNSFSAIEDELRSQYVVSYRPANFDADGRYRSIEITALKRDLQVRARKGYYAPRQ